MRAIWLSFLALSLWLNMAAAQDGPLRIKITQGVIEPLKFAIPEFAAENVEAKEIATKISRIVAADLASSGSTPLLPVCSHCASSHDSRWPSGRYVAEAGVEDEHEKPSDKAEPVAAPKDSKVEQLSGWMAAHCGIDSKAVATYAEALVGEGGPERPGRDRHPRDLAELDDGDWPESIKTLHLKKIKAAVAKGDFDAPEPEGAMGQDDEVSPTRPGSALALGEASCRLRARLRAGLCVHVVPLLCTGAS